MQLCTSIINFLTFLSFCVKLCKIDSEGKARKVVGCACVVVKVRAMNLYDSLIFFFTCLIARLRKTDYLTCPPVGIILQDYGEESEGLHIVQEYVKSH